VSYRPIPVFNNDDLEGEALQALIPKRRQADGALLRPEPERLAAAAAMAQGLAVAGAARRLQRLLRALLRSHPPAGASGLHLFGCLLRHLRP
jgi:hypothetical protein